MDHAPRFVALVDAARAQIAETDAPAVRQRMIDGDPFTLVDVRERAEWDRGHLPGAVHLGRGVLERDAEEALPDLGAPIVLYCGGGYRSALAAQSLGAMGYTAVESMDGGWRAWTGAGFPTETD
ncbi:rhodanese-like domain-containing protein [Rubrivirga sp. IMCC43871]|uniref:rhodanese-like domain-containing protein n=1 Tax=Rubrivirga sp. IMCC43871 TaxID=3391575 RepID=UPI0039901226